MQPVLDTMPVIDGQIYESAPVICFVCTGNTCRSPMAAAVYNYLSARAEGVEKKRRAISAGLYATGDMISRNAVLALEKAGIEPVAGGDYNTHVSCNITEELAASCELLIGVSSAHAMELMARFPKYAGKIRTLPQNISDPYGGDLARYERCLAEITAAVREEFGL